MAVNHVIFGNETVIDLRDDTVTADNLLFGAKAHGSDGEIITGTIASHEAVNKTFSKLSDSAVIPSGYYNSDGTVSIDLTERAKIIPANIKNGVSILGVEGAVEGLTLNKLTPNGVDITHYWMSKTTSKMYLTITYETKTNTRSDEYIVEAGKNYLARYIAPYGVRCQTAISPVSLIDNTANVNDCSMIAPFEFHGSIFFTAPMDGYLIMYKDNTETDGFQTECYEIT